MSLNISGIKIVFVLGYVHTVTFSHRFLLFGSKLEFPWDCGTIQSHAKTLPCARSLSVEVSASGSVNFA